MLAKLERSLPRAGYVYEPKWDGFRALVFRDGDSVDIRSRNDKKLGRYFPEIIEAIRGLPERRVVLDGELVIPRGAGLDFAALMTRLHPAASRVDELRRTTPASFVVFDVLAVGELDLRAQPFSERRRRLVGLLGDLAGTIVLTPSTSDPDIAATWLEEFSSRGIDGVVAKAPSMPYSPGKRTMVKVKQQRTLDVVVAGVRLMMTSANAPPAVGSLLLGLHDDEGALVHIGVVSQLTKARREELGRELAPLVTRLSGHPWEHGFGLERSPLGRLSGSAGRWSPDEMERDWIPLRPERVCEVAYDTIDEHRLRYPARLVRWRPDRDASSCRVDQLEAASGDVRAFLRS